ncbi:MAG: carbon-nitrogen hydrolase family protein, partial [Thermoanaerobaculia bacterium]|nr:carbon-nitrogen hydrolase family protein [Thermoanaerobaculia bacterium]
MNRPLRIALAQTAAGEDRDQNIRRGQETMRRAADYGAQLIVFPELAFDRFFPCQRCSTPPLHRAEPIPGPTTEAFAALAAELSMVTILNLYELGTDDQCFDCSPVIDADGTLLGRTRMVHVAHFPGFWEQDYYTPGDLGLPVYATAVGRVGVAICYDRHYPEAMRSLGRQGAELVVIPQAGTPGEWPEGLFEAEVRTSAFQ